MLRKFLEASNYGRSLYKVPPELRIQPFGSNMRSFGRRSDRSNLMEPELSLVRMFLNVVEQNLLASIQAHARNGAYCPT